MLVLSAITASATEARAYLDDTSDDIWFICRDADGYLVWYEDSSSTDAWGTGYSWDDLVDQYRLRDAYVYDDTLDEGCNFVHDLIVDPDNEQAVAALIVEIRADIKQMLSE